MIVCLLLWMLCGCLIVLIILLMLVIFVLSGVVLYEVLSNCVEMMVVE